MEFEVLPVEFRNTVIEWANTRTPYWQLLGMELLDFKKGWAKVRLPYQVKLTNPTGTAHGGALFSLADASAGTAVFGTVEKGEFVTTIEMKINYARPFTGGEVVAEAIVQHRGTNIAIADVELRNSEQDLIAKAQGTFMILSFEKAVARPSPDISAQDES